MGWERGGGSVQRAVDGQSRRVSRTCGPDHPSPLLCVVEPGLNILVLSPSQTVTPLSPGRGGARAGAAGVRDVCGPESDMPCPPCVCFVITSKAKLKKKRAERGHVARKERRGCRATNLQRTLCQKFILAEEKKERKQILEEA